MPLSFLLEKYIVESSEILYMYEITCSWKAHLDTELLGVEETEDEFLLQEIN